jgi:hypothetical protein
VLERTSAKPCPQRPSCQSRTSNDASGQLPQGLLRSTTELYLGQSWLRKRSPLQTLNTLCRQIRGLANCVRTIHRTKNRSYFAGLRGIRAGWFSMFALSTIERVGIRNRPSRVELFGCAKTSVPRFMGTN